MKWLYLTLGLVIVILQARLLSSDGGVGELFTLQSRLAELEQQLGQQQQLNQQLKQQVNALHNQPSALETLARQNLGMIAKDEVFVEVIELAPMSSDNSSL
jgi:cell division protein FtsB